MLPQLMKLDNAEVSQEERQQVRSINFDYITNGQNEQPASLQKKPS
jgi:DNA polymerase I-like protein with 3'-5' exonuclease and polymerase domains